MHNNHINAIPFDFDALFNKMRNEVTTLKNAISLYVLTLVLAYMAKFAVVNETSVDNIEKVLIELDDAIDSLQEHLEQSRGVRRFFINKALTNIINVQFTISNKTADFRLANR